MLGVCQGLDVLLCIAMATWTALCLSGTPTYGTRLGDSMFLCFCSAPEFSTFGSCGIMKHVKTTLTNVGNNVSSAPNPSSNKISQNLVSRRIFLSQSILVEFCTAHGNECLVLCKISGLVLSKEYVKSLIVNQISILSRLIFLRGS